MHFLHNQKSQIVITLVLLFLWVFFVVVGPKTFLSIHIYISFMSTIPLIPIIALGMTLVVVTGEMDLSFASNMAMSGFTFAVITTFTGSPVLGMIVGLFCGTCIGLINGLLIVKTGVPAIVATIGADFFWRGSVMLLSGGVAIALPFIAHMPGTNFFVGRIGGLFPAQSVWCLVVALMVALILHRTPWGDNLRFIGDNRQTAEMMGVPVAQSRVGVFTFLGFLASFAGILAVMELRNWWPTQGEGYLLLVFASVFIGGTSVHGGGGRVWGTLVGSIIIGMIEAGVVSAGWSGFWTRFVHGLVLITSVSVYALVEKRQKRQRIC